jgi:MGT family glycosyltransferase
MLPILLEQARSEQPDYILFDAMTVWGWQIATALDVPSVSSSATFAFSPQVMFAIQPRVMMTVLSTMFGGMKYVGPYSQIAKQIKAQHGVKSPPIGQALANPGTLNIIYTTKELQPAANTFKDNFLFIGPSIALRNDSAEFPLDELIGEQVIYISLGTVFNKSLDFYRECIKAFAVSPYKVVMSVGKSTNIANLGTLPPNFIVRNYVPQLDVLQRSDLFITHAGMGSVHEGLYYGVPMILVPQIFEQEIVASQITKAGAGVVLSKSKGSHDKILSMAETILKNSKYRSASQQLGTALKQADGTSHAADAILGLGKRHSCG